MNGNAIGHHQARQDQINIGVGSSAGARPAQLGTNSAQERWLHQHDGVDRRVQEIRKLSTLDVAALITNKMIGTGRQIESSGGHDLTKLDLESLTFIVA